MQRNALPFGAALSVIVLVQCVALANAWQLRRRFQQEGRELRARKRRKQRRDDRRHDDEIRRRRRPARQSTSAAREAAPTSAPHRPCRRRRRLAATTASSTATAGAAPRGGLRLGAAPREESTCRQESRVHARPVGTKLRWQSEGSAQAERVARAQVLCTGLSHPWPGFKPWAPVGHLETERRESPVVTLASP